MVPKSATDVVLSAAGGLPGELYCTWRSIGVGTFESKYGFSVRYVADWRASAAFG